MTKTITYAKIDDQKVSVIVRKKRNYLFLFPQSLCEYVTSHYTDRMKEAEPTYKTTNLKWIDDSELYEVEEEVES